jgi:hypothetical protein
VVVADVLARARRARPGVSPGRTFRQYLTANAHHVNRRGLNAGPAGLGRNNVNRVVEQITVTQQLARTSMGSTTCTTATGSTTATGWPTSPRSGHQPLRHRGISAGRHARPVRRRRGGSGRTARGRGAVPHRNGALWDVDDERWVLLVVGSTEADRRDAAAKFARLGPNWLNQGMHHTFLDEK